MNALTPTEIEKEVSDPPPMATVDAHGWGRVHRGDMSLARPEKRAALGRLAADMPGPAIGARRSYGDACLRLGGAGVDMTRLDRMLDLDRERGVLTVEAGARIGEVARLLAPLGWMPKVMPGTGQATVGGCVAMDVHGKNHHVAGAFGQTVERIRFADGTEAQAGDDLMRATIGGLGQTGAMLDVTLRLAPTPGGAMAVREVRTAGWDETLQMLEDAREPYSVAWIDCLAKGRALGRGVVELAAPTHGRAPARERRTVRFDAPRWALSAPVVKAFNRLYWGRVPASGRQSIKPLDDFFFPLDKIANWNRLYGKRGFHQFQCVVPEDASEKLRAMLERIARARAASPLAVLKRMGHAPDAARTGHMSFPMAGWTLAVDLPNRRATPDLVDALERDALEAGGRIYFAKDALCTPARAAAMFPQAADWARAANARDPERRLETDLTRRLKLRDCA
ncbi:MAG: FAD-binding oxidoreductase [Hasllibacter sp.]